MSSGSYQTNSLDWQIQLLQQRLSEWLERLFAPIDRLTPPNWSLSDDLLRLLFWLVAIGLTVWLGWLGFRLLRPFLGRFLPLSVAVADSGAAAVPGLSRAEWLHRSRSFAQQQNYREACRCLYFAALQQLDAGKLVPQQVSRTDGEYLRLVQPLTAAQPYQLLIRTHEWLCFSDAEISAAQFERCQQAFKEIQGAEQRLRDRELEP